MPQNKIQHYVPKCHLRPFCLDGSSINLYNIGQDRLIEGAPIKGQCARNYFYGKDGALEQALQEPEGVYATIVAKATNDPSSISVGDLAGLRELTLLQTFRTYGYVEKLMAFTDQFHADMAVAAPGKPQPPRVFANVDEAVSMAIESFFRTREHAADLDTCLIINESRRQFITSDDPAIHTNRFHFQKLRRNAFGLGSAGAMFFLPLTPNLAFMAFDGNVYSVPNRRGNTVALRHDDEASALNELQLLHARQNLYYSGAATGERLLTEFKKHSAGRPAAWNEFSYFVQIGKVGGRERYIRVNEMPRQGQSFHTLVDQVHVRPSRWSGLLQYRLRPRFADTGTLAGVLRPNHPLLREEI